MVWYTASSSTCALSRTLGCEYTAEAQHEVPDGAGHHHRCEGAEGEHQAPPFGHGVPSSEVCARVEGPRPFGGVQPTSSDAEGRDDEPSVALGENPRLGIKAFTKVGRVRVHVMQCSAHEHGRTLVANRIHIVDLERRVHRRLIEDVARSRPNGDPHRASRLDESVVHRQHDGELVDDDGDPADRALPQEVEALVVPQLLEPCFRHYTASHDPAVLPNVSLTASALSW